jgi:CRP-like cAMP-binding protein
MRNLRLLQPIQEELQAIAVAVSRTKGSMLFRAGDRCQGAYLVSSGKVTLVLEDSADIYPTRMMGPGTVVGLPTTLSGKVYSLTAMTAENAHLYFIPRRKLLTLLRGEPSVASEILHLLSEEIFRMRNAAKAAASSVGATSLDEGGVTLK